MAEQSLLLGNYRYDPLDRLASAAPAGRDTARFFYRRNRLVTQIQGVVRSAILHAGDRPLAQHQEAGGLSSATLLGTDHPCSVLHTLGAHQSQSRVYTAYGHASTGSGLASLLGFNGERCDPLTGHYLLGNGYRAFNPVLMHFNSPDNLSPFGAGGVNAYAYCRGDPINQRDSEGHMPRPGQSLKLPYPPNGPQRGPRPSGPRPPLKNSKDVQRARSRINRRAKPIAEQAHQDTRHYHQENINDLELLSDYYIRYPGRGVALRNYTEQLKFARDQIAILDRDEAFSRQFDEIMQSLAQQNVPRARTPEPGPALAGPADPAERIRANTPDLYERHRAPEVP